MFSPTAVETALVFAFFAVGPIAAQAPAAAQSPHFEVVSVKPIADPTQVRPMPANNAARPPGEIGRFDARPVSMQNLLTMAFGVKPYQLSGPSWMQTQFFDVSATAPAGASKDQLPAMILNMLIDRFHLSYRRETATRPVYALAVTSRGANLKPGIPDDDPSKFPATAAPITGPGGRIESPWVRSASPFGVYRMSVENGVLHYEFRNMTMAELATFLDNRQMELPVVDRTELQGGYQVQLEMLVSEAHGPRPVSTEPGGPAAEPGGSMRDSLKKQGLRLVRREAQIERIIIDRIDRTPTEN